MMLYTVFLVVCLSGMPVHECNRQTAVSVTAAPEKARGLGYCAVLAQQYISDTALVPPGTYLKWYCRPVEKQQENVG